MRTDYSGLDLTESIVTTAIDAFLPGLGTGITKLYNSTVGKKRLARLLKEAKDKANKFDRLSAKQQYNLNVIDAALADLNSSPARATNVGSLARDLNKQRINAAARASQAQTIADTYRSAADYSGNDNPNAIVSNLDMADTLASKYETKLK